MGCFTSFNQRHANHVSYIQETRSTGLLGQKDLKCKKVKITVHSYMCSPFIKLKGKEPMMYRSKYKEVMHMKRTFLIIVFCVLLSIHCAATTNASFHYESFDLGFSLTLPCANEKDITAEESESRVDFFHEPSREKYGGLIGSIEVVSPRSDFFAGHYDDMAYQVIAFGADRVYLWKTNGGGANSGREYLDSFNAASSSFSIEFLRQNLNPNQPDDRPVLQTTRHLKYIPSTSGFAYPEQTLTRGELAKMLYTLIKASNKSQSHQTVFSDISGDDCEQAVNYLASYGILGGYPDGTFRPDAPVSRSAFAVLLHRCQFAAPVGRYGDELTEFPDVNPEYWAKDYIYSASTLGWMNGSSDGKFYPEREITRAEAVTVINRMLGRDESYTEIDPTINPFSDLTEDHWAYENFLEAAGVLNDKSIVHSPQEKEWTTNSVYYFINEKDGWMIIDDQLSRTTDGGENWVQLGEKFPFTVSGIFFSDSKNGILLGNSPESSCILFRTTDGGQSWVDLLNEPNLLECYLPAKHFPTKKALMDSIIYAELRPASNDCVYLTVRYHPYEGIYVYDFEAIWQEEIILPGLSSRSNG